MSATCPECGAKICAREALCPECFKRVALSELPIQHHRTGSGALISGFVRDHSSKPGSERYQISKFEGVEVDIAKTSDVGVRFELQMRSRGLSVSGTIQDEDVNSLQKALESVVEDLDT